MTGMHIHTYLDPRTVFLHMPADEREALVIDMYDKLMRFQAQLQEKEKELDDFLKAASVAQMHGASKEKRTKSIRNTNSGMLPKI